jgi:hypothetical protein
MDDISKIQPPLRDKIEHRFGKILLVFNEKDNVFFYYSMIDTERGRHHFISYDNMAKLFQYKKHNYTEKQFKKVLNLFAFT